MEDQKNEQLEAIHRILVERYPMYQTDTGFEQWLEEKTAGERDAIGQYLNLLDGYGHISDEGKVLHHYAEIPDPAGVESDIRARLGKLSDESRRVLDCASIEGERFSAVGVAALCPGMSADEVPRLLEPAFDAGLVAHDGTERLYARASQNYRFVPLQARDLVYDAVDHRHRLDMHTQFVEFLSREAKKTEDEGAREMLAELISAHNKRFARPDGKEDSR